MFDCKEILKKRGYELDVIGMFLKKKIIKKLEKKD